MSGLASIILKIYKTIGQVEHYTKPPLLGSLTVSINSHMNLLQDPVDQSIVSLTILLRHKFVKQISSKVTNTLLFFVEKM